MVKLSIYPSSVRTFPYTGYLGLTPLKLEGFVGTALAGDHKPLLAKSITVSVRCYESRTGRVGTLQSNVLVDYTELLWSKPEGQEYAEIGDTEFPFRIILPADVGGHSTMTFPDYRIFWRIEAVINHIPIAAVGCRQSKHYELPWVRYDLPSIPPTLSTQLPVQLDSRTNKPRAPTIRYSVNTSICPIGPLDLVSITLHLLPTEPAVSIRSASLIVERRIQFIDISAPPSPRELDNSSPPASANPPLSSIAQASSPYHEPQRPKNSSNSTSQSASRSSSCAPSLMMDGTDDEHRPLLHAPPTTAHIPADSPSKIITTSVAGVESSGRFALDTNGVWTKTLTFQWPASKSNSRWAIGETIQSDMVSVRFFAKIKIIVSSPSGAESIELSEKELVVVTTNAAQRELAVSKYNKAQNASCAEAARAKSKSKSPRRRKRGDAHDPMPTRVIGERPVPNIVSPPRQKSATATSHASKSKPSSSRRPHTSPGPGDKAHAFDRMPVVCVFEPENPVHDRLSRKKLLDLTHSENGTVTMGSTKAEEEASGHKTLVAPSLSLRHSSSSSSSGAEGGCETGLDGKDTMITPDPVEGLDWAPPVEIRPRRRGSNDMLGLAHKLKRITTDRFAPRLPILAHSER